MRLIAFVALASLVASTSACDPPPAETPAAVDNKQLPTHVATDGVAIVVAGYGDALIADKEQPSPFRVECKNAPLVPDDYKQALAAGAQHARIKVPQIDEPLYGVLALCDMPSEAKGPASRAFRIQIPTEYVNATEGGRVSVVFEEVDVPGAEQTHTSWQLYLSRSPFAGSDKAALDRVGPKAIAASEATGKAHVEKKEPPKDDPKAAEAKNADAKPEEPKADAKKSDPEPPKTKEHGKCGVSRASRSR